MIDKNFTIGQVNLNYAEGSANGQPVLLVHGLGVKWQSFFSIIPELDKNCHLYALDLRGHGKSNRAESYKIQDYASDIALFIIQCIKEPAVLFGHSMGGIIGILLAAYYPEAVKALIIGDSALSVEFLKEFANKQRDKTIWWRELAKTKDVKYIESELKNELIPVPNRQELVPAHQVLGEDHPSFRFGAECFSQTDPDVLTANLEGFDETYAEYKINTLLPSIKCPVLIIQANPQLGGLQRDEDVKMALTLLPNAQHKKIDNVGHWLHVQDKEAVLNIVIPFLKQLS